MFSRFYLLIGLIALFGFGLGQYRGTSPFDNFAETASSAARSSSHTYHK